MATFKICVRKKRSDGFWPVYIRVTHDRKTQYVKTDKVVTDKYLSNGEVQDPYVLQILTKKIVDYIERLNKVDTESWTIEDVMRFLQTGDEELSFTDFCREHVRRMQDNGQVRNARNYELAYRSLEMFLGTTRVKFSMLTSQKINLWIKSLERTQRAKEMYPICIRQVFKAALLEYNDYDNGIIRIKTNPWPKVQIPKAEKPEKRAISAEEVRAFFAAPLPPTKIAEPLSEIGRDTAMMVLCLAGINTVDLYNLRKTDCKDGIIRYRRAKTTKSRTDGAYMEMRVPPILQPLMEKYATPEDDEYLLSFHRRFSTSDSFGSGANTGIKQICEGMGITKEDRYCVYTFRHTWATTAQNDCGATLSEVGFALNHSDGHEVTRGYVKIDFMPAWTLNERVVEFLLLSTEKSRQNANMGQMEPLFRFSAKHLVRGTAFFKGEKLGEVEDIGFNNVDEVISRLVPFVPEDVPVRSMVQFKIEVLDKGQTAFYERMKGKGF